MYRKYEGLERRREHPRTTDERTAYALESDRLKKSFIKELEETYLPRGLQGTKSGELMRNMAVVPWPGYQAAEKNYRQLAVLVDAVLGDCNS